MAEKHPDSTKLLGIKISLDEKLVILKLLDIEILDFLEEEEALVREIEQADLYKEDIYRAMVRIDQCWATKGTPKGGFTVDENLFVSYRNWSSISSSVNDLRLTIRYDTKR